MSASRLLRRDQAILEALEVLLGLLVVLGAADVQPEVVGAVSAHPDPCPHQAKDQVGEVEPGARLDVLEDGGVEQYTPIEASKSSPGFST